ncbi:MAG: tetraacyldisaccharide 4'-kinase [Desulfuromonadaceae bacterium]|nr:tetraacyldisaccharide 4'-kinase [Desulfuromonadaceae bacterium]
MKDRLSPLYRRLARDGARRIGERLLLGLLWPLGWLYGWVGWTRARCYATGFLPSQRFPRPVISVGNLAVGGTGKTPVVDYLCTLLIAQGLRVAVVSRGYGAQYLNRDTVRIVSAGKGPLLSAREAGDEPFLLAQRQPQTVVVIAPRRAEGIRRVLERFSVDVIVLDDGFQHLAVQRDLDLVLLDARCPFGNGSVLPAGLLRERRSALQRADLLLLTRWSEGLPVPECGRPVVRVAQVLDDAIVDLVGQTATLSQCRSGRAVAFAGIAQPEDFFHALREQGIELISTLCFADHSDYDEQRLQQIRDCCAGADFLLTTQKDAVKLRADQLPIPCYQVGLTLHVHDQALLRQTLFERVNPGCAGPTS